ncbi:LysR family transcriptional regulator [Orenia marismortui]|uniref:DNA-binding transcriptional LysR family regulator n=1 Tax=Orenia marismortui TaxID=46469 RepID=A0A4R8H9U4_9FIRM|nr:LysR family transcriptional regulator [Orenia marismortui]TDX52953.1 DNA-binding transcriptional LysR family regulator [Orenia marismortui]
MTLRELKIFTTVCRTGSMSEAGRQLYITQPAISQTILDLEDKLNIKLFERINRKLILTYAGKRLLKYSKRILLLIAEAENDLEDIANLKTGKLRIGASMTIGTYLLPPIIKKFTTKYPEIDLNFIIDNTSVIEKKILNNDIDLGLVEGPINSKDICFDPFYNDELFLISSKENPLSKKKDILQSDIQKEAFINREKGSGTREIIDKIMNKYSISYKAKHILNNIEAIKEAVKNNLGISILPEVALKDDLQSGSIKRLILKDIEFKRQFNIIYHKDKNLTELLNKFIEYIKDYSNLN